MAERIIPTGMGWMGRRLLSQKEKDRIIKLWEAGRVPRDIATALQRSRSTIYNYLYYGRLASRLEKRNAQVTDARVASRNVKLYEPRSAACPTCEHRLTIDTDGNGYMVEYCPTCVKSAA